MMVWPLIFRSMSLDSFQCAKKQYDVGRFFSFTLSLLTLSIFLLPFDIHSACEIRFFELSLITNALLQDINVSR